MEKTLENCKHRLCLQGSYPCNVCWLTEARGKWEAKEDGCNR